MDLIDLHPRFSGEQGSDRKVGILFDCPCDPCQKKPSELATWGCPASERTDEPHGEIICLTFRNPIGGGAPFIRDVKAAGPYWTREGETFQTITLSPSILKHGHWHGYIRAGKVVNA